MKFCGTICLATELFALILFSGCDTTIRQNEPTEKNGTDSIALLTRQIMEDSSHADLFADRARAYLKNGNIDPALRDLNQAITLQPENPSFYLILSDIYLVLGKTDNSLTSLKKAIKLDPEEVSPYLKLAEVYLILNNPEGANSAADQAIRIDRNHAESFYIKGISLLQAGDTANSILNLQISVRLDSVNFMSFMQLAAISIARGDTLSVQYLKQALRLRPQDERALFFLGMMYQEQGKFKEALENFRLVTQYYPKNKRAFYYAGYICLVELTDFQAALQEFQHAVDLDSTYVEAVYNLGRTHEALEEYQSARKCYRQSLELLPNYPLAVQGLNRLDDNGQGL
jgi:tetratricopeptide (TPR) repeat protein